MKHFLTLFLSFFLCLGASAIEVITLPQSLADATEGGQAVADLSKYKGSAKFVLTAHNTAGTNPTLDVKFQSSPPPVAGLSLMTGTTAGVALRTDTDTNIKLAASFTTPATITPSIYKTVLPLKKGAGLTTGTLTLELFADSSGPTGSALQSTTFNLATLTTAFQGVTFTFTKPATLAAATKYWWVLTSAYSVSATDNVTWRNTAVGSGGNSSIFATGWTGGATVSFNYYNYNLVFADVTGLAFTQVTTTSSIQELDANLNNLGFLRIFATITGTNTPAYIVGVGAIVKE